MGLLVVVALTVAGVLVWSVLGESSFESVRGKVRSFLKKDTVV